MNRIQRKLISDCLDCAYLMSEWERSFIQSLSQLPDLAALSAKQNSKLNKISSQYTRNKTDARMKLDSHLEQRAERGLTRR